MQKMIETIDLTFKYKNEDGKEDLCALNKINLTINKGEFVAIIGPNGSGKSTLAKHMNALLLPSSGKMFVKGMDTAKEENLWNIRQ
ncbi:MAG TPA: energy-coupling factor transporter ATPase, partial [Clostridiaceae bacterium]|nr:energy-coupling factor transporter ATPase [Clostridiaceae bacterium]